MAGIASVSMEEDDLPPLEPIPDAVPPLDAMERLSLILKCSRLAFELRQSWPTRPLPAQTPTRSRFVTYEFNATKEGDGGILCKGSPGHETVRGLPHTE